MKNFTLNHSTKQILVDDGCLFADIVHHFQLMRLDMTYWTIVNEQKTFTEIKHPLIERGVNSDPYFNPPPTVYM